MPCIFSVAKQGDMLHEILHISFWNLQSLMVRKLFNGNEDRALTVDLWKSVRVVRDR